MRQLEEGGGCYFNVKAYPLGAYVPSDGELLQCAGGGLWARKV